MVTSRPVRLLIQRHLPNKSQILPSSIFIVISVFSSPFERRHFKGEEEEGFVIDEATLHPHRSLVIPWL